MPKSNALNELLSSTQPNLTPTSATMPHASTKPPFIVCECQTCPEHDPDDTGEPCNALLAHVAPNGALDSGEIGGYLVERAGYACMECLPMMIMIGMEMTLDAIEPDPSTGEPTYIRVGNLEFGGQTFK